jgi:prepilin-type N-terminal cleavage/methylation domain-containing protein
MKLKTPFSGSSRVGSCRSNPGFTLPEILIALTIFLLMVIGITSANLFGLRMFQFNQSKLTATEWSRKTFGKFADEVRASNSLTILNVDTNGNFTGLLDGELQQGNALQIYPTTNTDSYTMYFINLSDETFRQTEAISSVGTNTVILADSVTNAIIFSAQDLSGNVLTNGLNNRMIHLTLEFYQPELFMTEPNAYKLETAVTRRTLD